MRDSSTPINDAGRSSEAIAVKRVTILALALISMPLCAAERSAPALQVHNLVPKFLKFYTAAAPKSVTEDERWRLWQREYHIAAVPPTPQGLALARRQLDAVWPRYAALISKAGAREAVAERDAQALLPRVQALINPGGKPGAVSLVLFVGQFDGNEFTAPPQKPGGAPTVVMPIETPHIQYALAQELMHAMQMDADGLKNGFAAPLGETVLTVGLAMRGAQRLLPGAPLSRYTWRSSQWLERCRKDSRQILRGMRPYLADADSATTMKFTYGTGTTGLPSEAYCAGWLLVGRLLDHGSTFAGLAKVPESAMPSFTAAKFDLLLGLNSGSPRAVRSGARKKGA